MMSRTNIRRKSTVSCSLLGSLVVVGLLVASPASAKVVQAHKDHHTTTHSKHVTAHDAKASKHGKQVAVVKHGSSKHKLAHVASVHLNCVQYVQHVTNLGLHGDGGDWWDNAEGVFARGEAPKAGAVMVFSRTDNLPYGHVAVVRAVQNKRSILVDHANWSPIHGRRGQVEKGVRVIDVSADNDWSEVRVWYAPTHDVGSTVYPLNGFIYPHKTPQLHGR
jgi:surface antigen